MYGSRSNGLGKGRRLAKANEVDEVIDNRFSVRLEMIPDWTIAAKG